MFLTFPAARGEEKGEYKEYLQMVIVVYDWQEYVFCFVFMGFKSEGCKSEGS